MKKLGVICMLSVYVCIAAQPADWALSVKREFAVETSSKVGEVSIDGDWVTAALFDSVAQEDGATRQDYTGLNAYNLVTTEVKNLYKGQSFSSVPQDISGHYVVWHADPVEAKAFFARTDLLSPDDIRSSLFLYDLSAGKCRSLSPDGGGPSVSGRKAVWLTPDRTRIQLVDVERQPSKQIGASDVEKDAPDIGRDLIVWIEGKNRDEVRGYKISTGDEFSIKSEPGTVFSAPRTDGRTVVWGKSSGPGVYAYDVESNKVSAVSDKGETPDVDDGVVVYSKSESDSRAVFGYDLHTRAEIRISKGQGDKPAISGKRVVWRCDSDTQIHCAELDKSIPVAGPLELPKAVPSSPGTKSAKAIKVIAVDQKRWPTVHGDWITVYLLRKELWKDGEHEIPTSLDAYNVVTGEVRRLYQGWAGGTNWGSFNKGDLIGWSFASPAEAAPYLRAAGVSDPNDRRSLFLTYDPVTQRYQAPMITEPAPPYSMCGKYVSWTTDSTQDIYVMNLDTGAVKQVAKDKSHKQMQRVVGDLVVWQTSDGKEVHGYNLSTGHEFSAQSGGCSVMPMTDGKTVVWHAISKDSWNAVYAYDVASGVTRNLSAHGSKEWGGGSMPDVDGNTVVYISCSKPMVWAIWGYDLSTGRDFRISDDYLTNATPSIGGNRVAWIDPNNKLQCAELKKSGDTVSVKMLSLPFDRESPALPATAKP
jgi:hypothetical protein